MFFSDVGVPDKHFVLRIELNVVAGLEEEVLDLEVEANCLDTDSVDHFDLDTKELIDQLLSIFLGTIIFGDLQVTEIDSMLTNSY